MTASPGCSTIQGGGELVNDGSDFGSDQLNKHLRRFPARAPGRGERPEVPLQPGEAHAGGLEGTISGNQRSAHEAASGMCMWAWCQKDWNRRLYGACPRSEDRSGWFWNPTGWMISTTLIPYHHTLGSLGHILYITLTVCITMYCNCQSPNYIIHVPFAQVCWSCIAIDLALCSQRCCHVSHFAVAYVAFWKGLLRL